MFNSLDEARNSVTYYQERNRGGEYNYSADDVARILQLVEHAS